MEPWNNIDDHYRKDAEKIVREYEKNPSTGNEYLDSMRRMQYNVNKKFLKKYHSGERDCMEYFKFISEMKTRAFNDLMNELNVTHLVTDEKYNLTKMYERDVMNPIKRGNFTIFGIIGLPGSGKSELAQDIAFKSQDANRKYKHRDVKIHLVWTQSDFNNILPILKKGDIIWKDEMPKTLRKGAHLEKWQIDNVLHVIRKYENTLIFVNPVEIKVDICDIYFQSAGMNFETRTNRFMVLSMDNILLKKYRYLGHIYSKLHDNDEFRDWYEQEKELFIQRMLKKSGDVRVDKKVANLLDNKEKEPDLLEDKQIQEKKQIQEEESFKYNITEEKVFNTIKREVRWLKTERDIEIFKEYKNGKLIEDIMKDTNTTESNVKRLLRQVQGAIYKYKGILFEREYFKWLKESKLYDKVVWEGASGKPDIYAYDEENNTLHIFSLKNYTIKKRPFHIKAEEFGAELKKAYKEHLDGNFKEIKVFAVIYDSITDKVEKIKLDYLNPENLTLV